MKKLLVALIAMPLFLPLSDAFRQESASHLFLQTAYADDDDNDSEDSDSDNDADEDDDRDDSQSQPGNRNNQGNRNNGSVSAPSPLRWLFGGQNRQRQERASPRRPAPAASLPQFASSEIIVFNISPQDLQSLLDSGFSVMDERSASSGAVRSHRLRPPSNTSLEDARDAVRALPSGGNADFNHFYRLDRGDICKGPHCAAFTLIDWPSQFTDLADQCSAGIRIGMVDTGLNENHSTFDGAKIEVLRLADKDLPASKASHGTAVAAILIGQPDTRTPGLLPDSELIAVDAFYRNGRDERADAFTLVEALYRLSEEQVSVINLSLSGPENSVLEVAIKDIKENRNIALISAAGNNGPSAKPAYPAAFPEVLAVTAVDKNKRIYRRANRGTYVDLAAPGVNVWTAASIKGAKWKTGTSFAVPFVSAAAAIARQNNAELSVNEIFELLKSNAEDLGEPGPDPTYGSGLLSVSSLCGN